MLSFLPGFIPDIVQAAPFILAFIIGCIQPLRRRPALFYLAFGIMVALQTAPDFGSFVFGGRPPAALQAYVSAFESLKTSIPLVGDLFDLTTGACTGVWFYLVVMFIGVLPKTPLVKRLYTVRSELSILGGIIVFGHVLRVIFFPLYFLVPQFRAVWGIPGVYFMALAGAVVAIPLLICFLVPWVTSFKSIRSAMSARAWKRSQKLAYPFMILMILQGLFFGLGHGFYDLNGAGMGMMSMGGVPVADKITETIQHFSQAAVYALLLVAYVALLAKRTVERRKKKRKIA